MSETASRALQRFQERFARAVMTNDSACEADTEFSALIKQPGFAVYRNTVMKGCIDALQANYPAVTSVVGVEWLRAAAAIYVRAHPPRQPVLLQYGDGFVDFLDVFPPAAQIPGLAQMARLDRYWTEAHIARDEAPVAAAAVARLDAAQLAVAVLHPHASARWCCFDGRAVAATWCRHRGFDEAHDEQELSGVLIVRPYHVVRTHGLDAAGCAFLDACAAGSALVDAAHAALDADANADLSQLMAKLLNAGAFGVLTPLDHMPQEDTQ